MMARGGYRRIFIALTRADAAREADRIADLDLVRGGVRLPHQLGLQHVDKNGSKPLLRKTLVGDVERKMASHDAKPISAYRPAHSSGARVGSYSLASNTWW